MHNFNSLLNDQINKCIEVLQYKKWGLDIENTSKIYNTCIDLKVNDSIDIWLLYLYSMEMLDIKWVLSNWAGNNYQFISQNRNKVFNSES